MSRAQLSNNAVTTLASAVVSTSTTSLVLASGSGSLFPSSGYFPVTLLDSSGNLEIVKCVSRSGDVLTVTRAQEGTTARTFASGSRVSLNVTAAVLNELAPLDGTGTSGTWPISISGNADTATTLRII